MSTDKTQSAIKEVRDQLFVDTADGSRLNIVADNLGFIRPVFGISNDDEWRALVKQLALGYKQIERSFRKALEICIGPDFDRLATISEAVEVGDTNIVVNDAAELVQVGTLVLSPGLATQETVEYCFIDYATNKVFLEAPTVNAHSTQEKFEALLVNDLEAGATSAALTNTSDMPTVYPYSVHIGQGTLNEEYVIVSNNDTSTNTLTISATSNSHNGFKGDYVKRALSAPADAGRVFIVFDVNDTVELPETGWLRIDPGTASVTSGNTETYALSDGQTLTVDVDGGGDQTVTFNTADFVSIAAATAAEVAIVITEDLEGASASAVGGAVVIIASSTGSGTTIQVTGGTANSALGFPTSLVTGIDEVVEYDENSVTDNTIFLKTPLQFSHAAGATVELLREGVNVSTLGVLQEGVYWSIHDTSPDELKILVPEAIEDLRVLDAAWLHDAVPSPLGSTTIAAATTATDTSIEIASAADFPNEAGMLTINGVDRHFYTLRDESATPNPILELSEQVGTVYGIGTTVDLFEVPYVGTDLEEGNPRGIGGSVIDDRYPGPYVYDPADLSPSTTSTTIASLHPPSTTVKVGVPPGRETIECEDLSLWDGLTTPFLAKIGRSTGFEEDLQVVDVTISENCRTATINGTPSAGATSIVVDYDATGSQEDFPETVALNTAKLTVLIGSAIISGNAETYALSDGQTLTVDVDGTGVQTATFNTADFVSIAAATAAEVAAVIEEDIDGVRAIDSGGFVAIYSVSAETDGDVTSSIEVTGGTANAALGFTTTISNLEEVTVVGVSLDDPAANQTTLTLSAPGLSLNRTADELVRLKYDVLTTDATTRQHFGRTLVPSALGHPVEFITDTISLTSSSGFSQTVGTVSLNYGRNRVNTRAQIVSIVSDTVYEFDDTSDFPTSDFPYQITLSVGRAVEELINVSANDTGLNRLTFSTAPVYTHSAGPAPFGSYAEFNTGDMETIDYQDVDGNDLILVPGQVLNKHTIGELVVSMGGSSIPRTDGYSYPFYLPPDKFICVKAMFDLIRAAGIKVTIVTF